MPKSSTVIKDPAVSEITSKRGLFISENVTAYAKIQGNGILYYLQNLKISLGKRFHNHRYVDVPLGSSNSIARKHAFLSYNNTTDSFELEVKGNSGVYIDEVPYEAGSTVPLKHKSKIQIGDVHVWFLLPDIPLSEATIERFQIMRIASIVNEIFDTSDLSEQEQEIETGSEIAAKGRNATADQENNDSTAQQATTEQSTDVTSQPDEELLDPYAIIETFRSSTRRPPFPYFIMVSHALNSLRRSSVKNIGEFLCDYSPYYRGLTTASLHISIRSALKNNTIVKFKRHRVRGRHEYSVVPDEFHIKNVRIIVQTHMERLSENPEQPIQQENELPVESTPEQDDELPAESTEPILDQQQNNEADNSQVGEETTDTHSDLVQNQEAKDNQVLVESTVASSDQPQHLEKNDIENPTENSDTEPQLNEQDNEKPEETNTEPSRQEEETVIENMDTSCDLPHQSGEQDTKNPAEAAIIDPEQPQEQQAEEEIVPESMDQEQEHQQQLPPEGMDSDFDPFKVIASFKYTDQDPLFETTCLITYILHEKSSTNESTGMTNQEITEKLTTYFPFYKSQYKFPLQKVFESMKYRRRYQSSNTRPKRYWLIPYDEFKPQFEDEVRRGVEKINSNNVTINENNKRPIENDDQQIDTPASKKQKPVDTTLNTTEKPISDTSNTEKPTITLPFIKNPEKNTIISISNAISKIKVKSPTSSSDKHIINTIKDLFELTTRRGRSALVKTLSIKLEQRVRRYLYNPLRYPLTPSILDTLPEAISYLPPDDVRKIAQSIEDSMNMGVADITPALPRAFGLSTKQL